MSKDSSSSVAKPFAAVPSAGKVAWGPLAAVIVTLSAYFGSQMLGSLPILIYALSRFDTKQQAQRWLDSSVIGQFLLVVLIEAIVLLVLYFFLKRRKARLASIGLARLPKPTDVLYALAGFAAYFPLLLASIGIVKTILPNLNIDQAQSIGFDNAHGSALILVFITLVILSPITEEILVRGFLYSGLKTRLSRVVSTLAASALFAAAHLEFGGNHPLVWVAAIDTFILSLVLISLREHSGSLWASIFLHMIKNTLAFLSLFIFHLK